MVAPWTRATAGSRPLAMVIGEFGAKGVIDTSSHDRIEHAMVLLHSICAGAPNSQHALYLFTPTEQDHAIDVRDRRIGRIRSLRCFPSVSIRRFPLRLVNRSIRSWFPAGHLFVHGEVSRCQPSWCCGTCALAQWAKLWLPTWLEREMPDARQLVVLDYDLVALRSAEHLWSLPLGGAMMAVHGSACGITSAAMVFNVSAMRTFLSAHNTAARRAMLPALAAHTDYTNSDQDWVVAMTQAPSLSKAVASMHVLDNACEERYVRRRDQTCTPANDSLSVTRTFRHFNCMAKSQQVSFYQARLAKAGQRAALEQVRSFAPSRRLERV